MLFNCLFLMSLPTLNFAPDPKKKKAFGISTDPHFCAVIKKKKKIGL